MELSLPQLVDELLAPLIRWAGDAWSEGQLRIAEEQLMTSILRTQIANAIRQTRSDATTLVVTTPAGHVHELGSRLAALNASTTGWHVEYLGPDLPAAEIAGPDGDQVRVGLRGEQRIRPRGPQVFGRGKRRLRLEVPVEDERRAPLDA